MGQGLLPGSIAMLVFGVLLLYGGLGALIAVAVKAERARKAEKG